MAKQTRLKHKILENIIIIDLRRSIKYVGWGFGCLEN